MKGDTDLGGPAACFPATRCSLVRATADPDPQVRRDAFAALVAAYWKPVYKYLRLQKSLANEDAKDLTQAFFARALEKDFFASYDPARARFRTYLRVCLDRFVAKERTAAGRLKRGGGVALLSLDFAGAEGELRHQEPATDGDLEAFFHREWVRSLFGLAVESLREQCAAAGKPVHFALFERYDLDGADAVERPTYAQLAAEFGLPTTQVTNYLAAVRRQFRALVLDRLRATTGSDDEFRAEARALLGGETS
jgi:DNA-directed RNA polymerase specialized sigma24 family protein